jgi:hypothetical protein
VRPRSPPLYSSPRRWSKSPGRAAPCRAGGACHALDSLPPPLHSSARATTPCTSTDCTAHPDSGTLGGPSTMARYFQEYPTIFCQKDLLNRTYIHVYIQHLSQIHRLELNYSRYYRVFSKPDASVSACLGLDNTIPNSQLLVCSLSLTCSMSQ